MIYEYKETDRELDMQMCGKNMYGSKGWIQGINLLEALANHVHSYTPKQIGLDTKAIHKHSSNLVHNAVAFRIPGVRLVSALTN